MSVELARSRELHHENGAVAVVRRAALDEDRSAELAALVQRQMELLGENPDRPGLRRTPSASRPRSPG